MTTGTDLAGLVSIFLEEAAEHVGTLETSLLELERRPNDAELLGALFRAAHSIKGGAATFGFPAIGKFTHHLESMLDRMRQGTLMPTAPLVDLLLRATDQLGAMLGAVGGAGPAPDEAALALELEAVTGKPRREEVTVVLPASERRWTIRFEPASDILSSGFEPLKLLRELSSIATIEETALDTSRLPALAAMDATTTYIGWRLTVRTTQSREALAEVFDFASVGATLEITPVEATPVAAPAAAAVTSAPVARTNDAAASIRVSVDKADKLVNLVGELVIHQSMVADLVRNFDAARLGRLAEAVATMERTTRELQERVLSIRMVPVGVVLNRFPRMVRELAAKLGKQVEIELVGEDTELDKSVVELISDPLTHLVRNAVDHGLEQPADRVAAGKPSFGTLTLAASHQSGSIVIEVRDDGHGLDVAKIRKKAIEAGLIGPTEELSEAATYALILRPGFSTADTVSDISGRGVGLDVVKRNLEALHGSVQIASTPGQGASFKITLPLTLAILDGLSLRVGAEAYVLPLATIVESMRVRPEQHKRVLGRGELIDVRGESLPLVRLHRLFAVDNAVEAPTDGLVVVVEHGGSKVGILVDEITGQPQVVIKSLETHYKKVEGLMGATILGDGHVTLILDVPGLIRQGHRTARQGAAA